MANITIDQLVQAQAAARQRLTQSAVRAAVGEVRRFNDWYTTVSITAFAERVAAQVEALQRQLAATTDAYLARVATLLTGRSTPPVGRIDVAGLRRGVSHPAVFGRLADQYRWRISEGDSQQDALTAVINRAETVVDTDMSLAFRAQAREFMVVRNVSGYRRIIRPELSKHGSCGLCIAASDRFYHRGDLLPLHALCKCEVLPIINSIDPGKLLNEADLKALYDAAGTTAAAALKRVRVAVHQHGELGPVLAVEGQHFRRVA